MFTPWTGKSRNRFTKVRHRYGEETGQSSEPELRAHRKSAVHGELARTAHHTLSVSDKLLTESSHCLSVQKRV